MKQIAFIFSQNDQLHHFTTYVQEAFTPNVELLDTLYKQGQWLYLTPEELPADLSAHTIIGGVLIAR